MRRLAIVVQYDGSSFHGWQRQTTPDGSPLRTVQGEIDAALVRVMRQPVTTRGASRTDAGVHAVGQVAAFNAETTIPVERVSLALTSALPSDVRVVAAADVPATFDPIRDAVAKGYRYRIRHGSPPTTWPDLERRGWSATVWPELDAAAMGEAAAMLVGTHDFTSFAHTHHGRESAVRTILRCGVVEEQPSQLRIEVVGTGFLYNMVRIIAGTLVEVGRGRRRPQEIPEMLAARDRRSTGPTMPPEGLCLMWIEYPPSLGAPIAPPTAGGPRRS